MLSSLLFPAYKLIRKNTQPENMCEKTKDGGGTVSRTIVYDERAGRRVLSKRCNEKFRKIHNKTYMPESSFWCFLISFAECKSTLFTEKCQSTESDYSSINRSEGSIGKRNCSYDK